MNARRYAEKPPSYFSSHAAQDNLDCTERAKLTLQQNKEESEKIHRREIFSFYSPARERKRGKEGRERDRENRKIISRVSKLRVDIK